MWDDNQRQGFLVLGLLVCWLERIANTRDTGCPERDCHLPYGEVDTACDTKVAAKAAVHFYENVPRGLPWQKQECDNQEKPRQLGYRGSLEPKDYVCPSSASFYTCQRNSLNNIFLYLGSAINNFFLIIYSGRCRVILLLQSSATHWPSLRW